MILFFNYCSITPSFHCNTAIAVMCERFTPTKWSRDRSACGVGVQWECRRCTVHGAADRTITCRSRDATAAALTRRTHVWPSGHCAWAPPSHWQRTVILRLGVGQHQRLSPDTKDVTLVKCNTGSVLGQLCYKSLVTRIESSLVVIHWGPPSDSVLTNNLPKTDNRQ